MKRLIMTSSSFTGQVVFEYNEAGLLEAMRMDADMTDKQRAFLGGLLPWTINDIEALRASAKTASFILQDRELTFAMFWNRYNDKSRSSRKKTEVVWNKLSTADQVKAYLYIPTYLKNKGSAEKKHATTYLNDELWNN